MLHTLLTLLFRPSAATGGARNASSRREVCPPGLLHDVSLWPRFGDWLRWPAPSAGMVAPRVLKVRQEFIDSLADLQGGPVDKLRHDIERARSLRELWHWRTAVFGLVSLGHSQHEAHRRLAALNRHFPTRAPRSGFSPL